MGAIAPPLLLKFRQNRFKIKVSLEFLYFVPSPPSRKKVPTHLNYVYELNHHFDLLVCPSRYIMSDKKVYLHRLHEIRNVGLIPKQLVTDTSRYFK